MLAFMALTALSSAPALADTNGAASGCLQGGGGLALLGDLSALPAPTSPDGEEVPEYLQGLSENFHHYDDDNFKAEVLDQEGLVLVDFWASLCAPCRDMIPILSTLSDDYEGQVQVGHLDILDDPDTPKQYGITAGPYMVLFRDGEVVARHEGSATRAQLEAMIAKAQGDGQADAERDSGGGWFSWWPW